MNVASTPTRNSQWLQKALQLMTVTLSAAVIVSASGCGNPGAGQAAEVVRVIDGDTLVVTVNSEKETVRLLNVDTPETKDPNKPVECMGEEATNYLEHLAPPGTEVGLDYDVERKDQYGRTLAAVFLADETLVNAEIVRQGFGVPVVFEPNRKYYDKVLAAQDNARQAQAGLYDPTADCTVPAAVGQALETLEAATAAPVGTSAATAGVALAGLATALAAAKALDKAVANAQGTAWVAAASSATLTQLVTNLKSNISAGEKRHSTVAAVATRLQKSEAAAAKAKAAEAKQATEAAKAARAEQAKQSEAKAKAAKAKQAAAVKAEKERVAAAAKAQKAQEEQQAAAARAEQERLAAVERERIRNLPPAPQPYVPPAPAPVQQDPYPGYTGPRCYAPGGKTWKPCP